MWWSGTVAAKMVDLLVLQCLHTLLLRRELVLELVLVLGLLDRAVLLVLPNIAGKWHLTVPADLGVFW
jgi:hypothetical protein